MTTDDTIKIAEHTLLKSVTLHLMPGLIMLALYVLLAPVLFDLGLPSFLSVILAAALVISPFELGYLYWLAKKNNTSIRNLITYKIKVRPLHFTAIILLLLVFTILVAGIFGRLVDAPLAKTIYSQLPEWFNASNLKGYSMSILSVVFILRLVVISIVSPVIEEFYFRGFLLPRMPSWLGQWSPALHSLLFSIQHFIQPEGNVTRTLAVLPVAYAVKWKKNVFIGIIWHCTLNLLSALTMIQMLRG